MIVLDIGERATPSRQVGLFHVEVELEIATILQKGVNPLKDLFQIVQAHQVIKTVEGRENCREAAVQRDVAGIPDKKFHLRRIFSRYGNHPL